MLNLNLFRQPSYHLLSCSENADISTPLPAGAKDYAPPKQHDVCRPSTGTGIFRHSAFILSGLCRDTELTDIHTRQHIKRDTAERRAGPGTLSERLRMRTTGLAQWRRSATVPATVLLALLETSMRHHGRFISPGEVNWVITPISMTGVPFCPKRRTPETNAPGDKTREVTSTSRRRVASYEGWTSMSMKGLHVPRQGDVLITTQSGPTGTLIRFARLRASGVPPEHKYDLQIAPCD